jgi:23S rRNA (uracil1939-C5)-methyltransferase
LPSPRTLGYRSRARVAVCETAIGFRGASSRNVIDVERCAVLDSDTQQALDDLRRSAHSDVGTRDVEIRGFGGQAAGLRVGVGAFFQANGALWDSWAQTVAAACGEAERIVELYAGVGFYTVHLASRFKRVIAVERARSASDLRYNTDAEVIQMSAEHFCLTQLAGLAPDVVLLNPPRTGCDPVVIDALRSAVPQRTVYVSCDPATLARDIARLGDAFHVSRVVAIDALPQTHHVESLTVLSTNE